MVTAREAHAEVGDTRAVARERVDDHVGHALRLLGRDRRVARVARHACGGDLLAHAACRDDDAAAAAGARAGRSTLAAAACGTARAAATTAARRAAHAARSHAAIAAARSRSRRRRDLSLELEQRLDVQLQLLPLALPQVALDALQLRRVHLQDLAPHSLPGLVVGLKHRRAGAERDAVEDRRERARRGLLVRHRLAGARVRDDVALVGAAAAARRHVHAGQRRAAADVAVLEQDLIDRRAVRVALGVVGEPFAGEQLRHPRFVVVVDRPRVIQLLDEEQVRFQPPEVGQRLLQREAGAAARRPPLGRVRIGREAEHEPLRVEGLRLQPPHAQQRRQEHGAGGGAQHLAAGKEVVAFQHAQFLTRSYVLADDRTADSRSCMVPPPVSDWYPDSTGGMPRWTSSPYPNV